MIPCIEGAAWMGCCCLGSRSAQLPNGSKHSFDSLLIPITCSFWRGGRGGEGGARRKLPNFTKWGPAAHNQVKLGNFPPAAGEGEIRGGEPRAWALGQWMSTYIAPKAQHTVNIGKLRHIGQNTDSTLIVSANGNGGRSFAIYHFTDTADKFLEGLLERSAGWTPECHPKYLPEVCIVNSLHSGTLILSQLFMS